MGMSIGPVQPFSPSPDTAAGANTKIKNNTVASFNNATLAGNNANVIASTTTFRAGEANIAASTDSLLIPAAYNPRAIGATQFVHTAMGIPAIAPNNVFKYFDPVRRRGTIARNTSAAGPNKNENVIPIRFASSQFTVVRHTRTRSGMFRSN